MCNLHKLKSVSVTALWTLLVNNCQTHQDYENHDQPENPDPQDMNVCTHIGRACMDGQMVESWGLEYLLTPLDLARRDIISHHLPDLCLVEAMVPGSSGGSRISPVLFTFPKGSGKYIFGPADLSPSSLSLSPPLPFLFL